jgi:hypothetical protein
MSFSPIAGRELAVAARQATTHRVRFLSALLAVLVAGAFIAIWSLTPFNTAVSGQTLFRTLTWMVLPASLVSGLFFTADCLSEEKRDGTIGLLFLTDLRAYDVIAGKLLATSLRAVEVLLACFPILAIPVIMGGVSGTELSRTILALSNALFCSLAAGLMISSVSRESFRATGATLVALLILIFGGPLLDYLRREAVSTAGHVFSLTSPGYAFVLASSSTAPFYLALVISHVCGWLMLGVCTLALPRFWQSAGTTRSFWARPLRSRISPEGSAGFLRRRKSLDRNPLTWFFTRESGRRVTAWAMTVLMFGAFCSILLGAQSNTGLVIWSSLGGTFQMLLYLAVAFQATRSLVEARKAGMLELLLATPASADKIVHAQWSANLRWFLLPAVALAGANLVVAVAGPDLRLGFAALQGGMSRFESIGISLLQTIAMLANFSAIAWFGMWMALTSRSGSSAALRTLIWVMVVPAVLIMFATMVVTASLAFGAMTNGAVNFGRWFGILSAGVGILLALLKDLGFIYWSRKKLAASFRERVGGGEPASLLPPVLQPAKTSAAAPSVPPATR